MQKRIGGPISNFHIYIGLTRHNFFLHAKNNSYFALLENLMQSMELWRHVLVPLLVSEASLFLPLPNESALLFQLGLTSATLVALNLLQRLRFQRLSIIRQHCAHPPQIPQHSKILSRSLF